MAKSNIAKKKSSSGAKHKSSAVGGGGGGAAHQKILNVAAAMKTRLGKESVERSKLSALTGIHGKSTIGKGLTKLKNLEWAVITSTHVAVTDLGMEHADISAVDQSSMPTSNAEYIESVVEHHQLKPVEAIANAIAVLKDGATYKKKDLANKIKMTMNSTFGKVMTSLKTAGIAEYVGKDEIRLADEMFQFEPRP